MSTDPLPHDVMTSFRHTEWHVLCENPEACVHLGVTFSAMAVLSLMVVMPASLACDQLGRKWTIIPSCLGIAAALCLMANSSQYKDLHKYAMRALLHFALSNKLPLPFAFH